MKRRNRRFDFRLTLGSILLLACAGPTLAQEQPTPTIPPGYRVVSIKAAPFKFAIKPGNRVNVVGFEKGSDNGHQHDVVENARVFSIDERVERSGAGSATTILSLLVTVEDAKQLALAGEHCALEIRIPDAADSQRLPKITLTGGRPVHQELFLTVSQSQVLTVEESYKFDSVKTSNASVQVQPLKSNRIRVGAVSIGTSKVVVSGDGWERAIQVKVQAPQSLAAAAAAADEGSEVDLTKSNPSISGDLNRDGKSGRSLERSVEIEEGDTHRIVFPRHVHSISTDDPSIVELKVLTPQEIVFAARKAGRAKVRLVMVENQKAVIDVTVRPSTSELEKALKKVFPAVEVRLVPLRTSVVLMGEVEDPEQRSDIEKIAKDYYPSVINRLTTKARTDLESSQESKRAALAALGVLRTQSNLPEEPMPTVEATASSSERETMAAVLSEIRALRKDVQKLTRMLRSRKVGASNAAEDESVNADSQAGLVDPLGLWKLNRWNLTLAEAIKIAQQNRRDVLAAVDSKGKAGGSKGRNEPVDEYLENLLLDVELAYWRLANAKANLDAFREFETRLLAARKRLPDASEAASSNATLLAARDSAKRDFLNQQSRLRYLLGLAAADGRLIWPVTGLDERASELATDELQDRIMSQDAELATLNQARRVLDAQRDLINVNGRGKEANEAIKLLRQLQTQIDEADAKIAVLRTDARNRIAGELLVLEQAKNRERAALARVVQLTDQLAVSDESPDARLFALTQGWYEQSVRHNELRKDRREVQLKLLRRAWLLRERHNAKAPISTPTKRSAATSSQKSYRTEHFIVSAGSQSREVALSAEKELAELRGRWLSGKPAAWVDPCVVSVNLKPQAGSGGATSYMFDKGRLMGMKMTLQAKDLESLHGVIAHEVAHLVLAEAAGRPLPRWLDEGLSVSQESEEEQRKMRQLTRQYRAENRLMPLKTLLGQKQYPRDVLPIFAQGHSLVQFLIERSGEERLAALVKTRGEDDAWEAGLAEFFGFQDLAALEQAWLASLDASPFANELAQTVP